MKNTISAFAKKSLAVVLVCAMALAVSPVVSAAKSAKKPKLNKSTTRIEEGLADELSVKKNGFTIKSIKWASSDKTIAKVNKKGVVEGIAPGKATITATVKAVAKGKKKVTKFTLKCKVTVIAAPGIDGGWETCDKPGDVSDLAGFIDFLLKDPNNGVSYEPVALLATQVVAGTNYRVLCRKNVTTPAKKTTYSIVEFYVDLDGNASPVEQGLTGGVFDMSLEAAPEEVIPGGWERSKDVNIPDVVKTAAATLFASHKEANLKPVAIVENQASTGTYKVICEYEIPNSDPGDNPSYAFVDVAIKPDLSGADITSVKYAYELAV